MGEDLSATLSSMITVIKLPYLELFFEPVGLAQPQSNAITSALKARLRRAQTVLNSDKVRFTLPA